MGEEGWWVCQILTEMLQQAEAALRQQEGPVESRALDPLQQEVNPKEDKEEDQEAHLEQEGEEASTGEEEAQMHIMQ